MAIVLVGACGDDPATAQLADDIPVLDDAADAGLGDLDASDAAPEEPDGAPDLPAEVAPDLPDEADAEDIAEEEVFDPTVIDEATPLSFDPEAVETDPEVYPLGVQAGAMRPNSVLLWTFVPDRGTRWLRVWRESEVPGEVLLVTDERVVPSEAGYFHVPVEDLAPGAVYHYAFFIGEPETGLQTRSPIGRVRTAIAADSLEPLTIGSVSCTDHEFQPWEALERLADEEVDLFVHAGDMSYNDGAATLEEYREAWFETLSDPGYRALYASTGLYATWDDHEVENDFNAESVDPEQLATARQAYLETLAFEPGPDDRIWQSWLWGQTAEFIVLDCRSERRPSTRFSEDAVYISPEQMAFLQERLANSPAHFKIIVNSVPITDMPILWDIASGDRWEGYASQRTELLAFIAEEEIANVWFLSGDFHVGFVSQVAPDGDSARLREVAAGPGGNGPNPLGWTLVNNDQFLFSHGDFEAYTTMTFDPVADEVRIRFVNDGGEVLYDEVLSEE